ncbi:MAG: hypothetical protein IPG12_11080 [Saprospiraceae bacterium]|nr:hypothetical protein [Saprospiraceae bacterium]
MVIKSKHLMVLLKSFVVLVVLWTGFVLCVFFFGLISKITLVVALTASFAQLVVLLITIYSTKEFMKIFPNY